MHYFVLKEQTREHDFHFHNQLNVFSVGIVLIILILQEMEGNNKYEMMGDLEK